MIIIYDIEYQENILPTSGFTFVIHTKFKKNQFTSFHLFSTEVSLYLHGVAEEAIHCKDYMVVQHLLSRPANVL